MSISPLPMAKGRVLRVNNVSRRFGVPERTIRYWARNGRLPAFKITPKIWGFYSTDVEAFGLSRGLMTRVVCR